MNHWMWPVSLVGILSTAVVCGTDMFFLTELCSTEAARIRRPQMMSALQQTEFRSVHPQGAVLEGAR
jgi:hypothetical protein